MGFGAGSAGLFLEDESEGRTGNTGKENRRKVGKIKSGWIKSNQSMLEKQKEIFLT